MHEVRLAKLLNELQELAEFCIVKKKERGKYGLLYSGIRLFR
ncbi:MAG: hypothetical protein QXW32_06480 [Nitrososphaerales archaeon]